MNNARKIVKTKVYEQTIIETYITEVLQKKVDLPEVINDPRIVLLKEV